MGAANYITNYVKINKYDTKKVHINLKWVAYYPDLLCKYINNDLSLKLRNIKLTVLRTNAIKSGLPAYNNM